MWTSSSNRLDRHIKSGHGYYGIIPKDTQTRKRQGEGGLNGCKSILQGVKNSVTNSDYFLIYYWKEIPNIFKSTYWNQIIQSW